MNNYKWMMLGGTIGMAVASMGMKMNKAKKTTKKLAREATRTVEDAGEMISEIGQKVKAHF